MKQDRIVIVGYDAVSPLGTDIAAQWQRALAGNSGIRRLTRFSLTDDFPVKIAGQVENIDTSGYPFLSPRQMANWKSPIFKHAMLVVHRALLMSGLEITAELSSRTAVTFSSAVGGLDAVLEADRKMIAASKLPHPFTNPNSCINMVGGKISILTNAKGPIVSPITACATGVTSIIIGANLITLNRADLAICGAVDFCLVEPIVAGFATMNGAYRDNPGSAGPDDKPETASRPFSSGRRGFVISEGAGCILIARQSWAKAHGIHADIEIAGYGMTSDASHFVAPNRDTVGKCMDQAIRDAGISPQAIAAVNAHAASTKIGDKIEYEALKDVFKQSLPPISANKSMIGHAMGASSAIEAILAIEGMRRNILLPTINYLPDQEIEIDCVAEGARPLVQEYVLKNSFGFGGCNACIVFRRIN